MAAATGALFVAAGLSSVFRWNVASLSGGSNPDRTTARTWPSAVSIDRARPASLSQSEGVDKKQAETVSKPLEASDVERRSMKDYFEESKSLIVSDGGPPRWFSPLECAFCSHDSPLLLYLPGLDGVGLGLILHHQSLGKIFDMWCLHIPSTDRTTFPELVQIVEGTVRSEFYHLPGRPIYLVGDSLGGCLALSVAARNLDIDLILILANPATSFSKSLLQPVIALLEIMPGNLDLSLPYMLSLMTGDPLKMLMATIGFSVQNTVGELSQGLLSLPFYISVMADIFPRDTLLWKLQMLKSASGFTNSRLHAIKAQTLILSSGKDQMLPSEEEGERLRRALPKCEIRKFNDSGHFLFLESGFDLAMTIRGAGFYRRRRNLDYVSDYVPPTPSEFKKVYESYRWIDVASGTTMFSTLEDGKIVKGLKGIPSEGPVLFVGYHMLLGLEIYTLVAQLFLEKNIVLRGIAHPMTFTRFFRDGKLPDLSVFDTFRLMGAVPASPMNLHKLLSSKSFALLYPGGMREALHRKGEEYKLFWPEQSEFVRMAARFGAKIVPFGVVGEDDFGEVVIDYNDLMNIPYFRGQIEELTSEAVKLRSDFNGEVANQDVHAPGILPKFPGRLYFLFGKPIDTIGRRQELRDKENAHKLYLHIKSEVEMYLDYLKEKRNSDPYRNLFLRLVYQAMHGFSSEAPTFEL